MSTTPNENNGRDMSWISAFLLVFGCFCVVIAGLAIMGHALLLGLLALGIAILVLAMRRSIENQETTASRLRKIETELTSRRGDGA